MKKIVNILTYYRSNSFGAKMQAFALYRKIEELGFKAVMLDVRSTYERPFVIPIKIYQWQSVISSFFSELFCKRYMPNRSQVYLTPSELYKSVPAGDCYVVGSDQVWNPEINREFCDCFFFDFVPEGTPKFAYSASFGTTDIAHWSSSQKETAKRNIAKFMAVGVREQEGQAICQEEFNCDSKVVCDPTFLHDFAFYKDKFLNGVANQGGGMVCFKLISIDESVKPALTELTTHFGKGLCIGGWNRSVAIPNMKKSKCYSIKQWLHRLYSADFIVTDSFHGCVFSIIFRKQFVVVVGDATKTCRLQYLLKSLGLAERFYSNNKELLADKPWLKAIDYSQVEDKISSIRQQGISFLEKTLKSI